MRFITYVTALALLIGAALPGAAAELLDARAARESVLRGEAVLVDIRTPDEWTRTGVPDVAHTLDMQDEDFLAGIRRLIDDNPGRTLALICATGGRSAFVTRALNDRGIRVIHVPEGVLGSAAGPGWLGRDLPVRRPGAPRVE